MKKQNQLGMNPSTASGRLVKDLLFAFVEREGHTCYHCRRGMTRDTFSIEHKKPWLDSEDPVGLYFDLSNIAFSHHSCNVAAARRPHKKYETPEAKRQANTDSARNKWQGMTKEQQQARRREKYQRHGK